MRIVILSLMAACAFGQAPDADGHNVLLARMKEAAAVYIKGLRDFLRIETATRTTAHVDATKIWKPLETRELAVSYVSGKLNYKLLSVNGDASKPEKRVKKGYFNSSGEFAGVGWVFEPKAKAEFEWDREETASSGRTCVFRYRVPHATTNIIINVNLEKIPTGHRGRVYADCETGAVLRVQIETDPATARVRGRNIAVGMTLDIRYAPATIASQEFLLPKDAELIGRFHTTLTKSDLKFVQYRKYDSSSTVTFGKAEPK